MKAALLPDRGVVKVAGDNARNFLNGLFTADIGPVTPDEPRFGALLTPQGKILVDFIVVAEQGEAGFLFDCPRALAKTLVDKLNFYKLRAKITAENLSDTLAVLAAWDGNARPGTCYRDPRLAALGWRTIIAPDQAGEAVRGLAAELLDAEHYEAHRIALGIPRGGLDFNYGDAFPHEADMDQLNGVDFAKGCYVGQEVVSRMEHRATVRTRVVPVAYAGGSPAPGEPVTAGDKTVGTMGSSAKGRALALLRLDRVADALAAGTPILCGGATLRPVRPDWARFAWPGDAKAAE